MEANGKPVVQAEIVEDDGREIDSAGALVPVSKGELDMQIVTAKRYPRSVEKFKEEATKLALQDDETAGAMFYSMKRGGKTIEGPSVRLAEVCVYAWGNLHGGASSYVEDKFAVGRGVLWDLERNNRFAFEVKRRITNSSGQKYNEDMIGVTQNAAAAIAFRQVAFKVIPAFLVKSIYDSAKQKYLAAAAKTVEARRQRAMEWFQKAGAKPEEVLKVLGRAKAEEITAEDLVTLQGFRTAMTDGDTSWATILKESAEKQEPTTVKTGALTVENLSRASVAGADDSHGKSADEVKAASTAQAAASTPAQTTTPATSAPTDDEEDAPRF